MSQRPPLVLLHSTSWPSELGVMAPSQMGKLSAGWGAQHGGHSKPVGARQGAGLPWLGAPLSSQDLAFVLQGLMGNVGQPGLKGDKVI